MNRILLAMSDHSARHAAVRALRAEGHEVIEVTNGLQLLDRLARSLILPRNNAMPDIVVTDADMGGMAGLDVLQGMRRTLTNVRLVVLAALDDIEARATAERIGAAMVLDTPVDLGVLVRALRSIAAPLPWVESPRPGQRAAARAE